jgi:tryptophanyl-tRNA synthetase
MTKTSGIVHRVFSGVQPSGSQVHIGNYLGAMRRFVTLAKEYDTTFCLVDLHALTSVDDSPALQGYTQSLAAAYLAIGLDPQQTILFRQSDVPEVCELTWYLACQFPLGLLERGHSLKDARAKGEAVSSGRMYYPVLMAADILLYQKQHVEMTRDVCQRFNHLYGDVFPMPEPLIEESTGVIPGLDGQKMSKSYDNYIGLFEPAKKVRKKVMRIVTDSKSVEDVKDPENCNVFQLFRFFASKEEQTALAARYTAGGMGYGEAKQQLFEAIEREVEPLRDSYNDWISRPDDMIDILRDGAARARERASETLSQVRDAVGVGRPL